MRPHVRIAFLAVLLAAFSAYAYFSSAPLGTGADLAPAATADLQLFLNNEPVGSVANMAVLKSRLRSMKKKLPNFNAPGGELPNIGRIVFYPEPGTAMTDIGKVSDELYVSLDYPSRHSFFAIWDRNACVNSSSDRSTSDRPAVVLSTAKLSPNELRNIQTTERCLVRTMLNPTKPMNLYGSVLVKSYQVAYTTLEISAAGTYLINEPNADQRVSPSANLANPQVSRRLNSAVVKQRQIAAAALDQEVSSWFERRVVEGSSDFYFANEKLIALPMVVNGGAKFSSLSEVLRRARQPNTIMDIVIDNTGPR